MSPAGNYLQTKGREEDLDKLQIPTPILPRKEKYFPYQPELPTDSRYILPSGVTAYSRILSLAKLKHVTSYDLLALLDRHR